MAHATTSSSCPKYPKKGMHGANSAKVSAHRMSVKTPPLASSELICKCLRAISASLVSLLKLPTSCPTNGVKPIIAPIANTMMVKKIALEKLTAAKSVVP